MYKRVTEEGDLLTVGEMQFLEDRLELYNNELMDHLENGTRPPKMRADHVVADIQMIITMMDSCIETIDKES